MPRLFSSELHLPLLKIDKIFRQSLFYGLGRTVLTACLSAEPAERPNFGELVSAAKKEYGFGYNDIWINYKPRMRLGCNYAFSPRQAERLLAYRKRWCAYQEILFKLIEALNNEFHLCLNSSPRDSNKLRQLLRSYETLNLQDIAQTAKDGSFNEKLETSFLELEKVVEMARNNENNGTAENCGSTCFDLILAAIGSTDRKLRNLGLQRISECTDDSVNFARLSVSVVPLLVKTMELYSDDVDFVQSGCEALTSDQLLRKLSEEDASILASIFLKHIGNWSIAQPLLFLLTACCGRNYTFGGTGLIESLIKQMELYTNNDRFLRDSWNLLLGLTRDLKLCAVFPKKHGIKCINDSLIYFENDFFMLHRLSEITYRVLDYYFTFESGVNVDIVIALGRVLRICYGMEAKVYHLTRKIAAICKANWSTIAWNKKLVKAIEGSLFAELDIADLDVKHSSNCDIKWLMEKTKK